MVRVAKISDELVRRLHDCAAVRFVFTRNDVKNREAYHKIFRCLSVKIEDLLGCGADKIFFYREEDKGDMIVVAGIEGEMRPAMLKVMAKAADGAAKENDADVRIEGLGEMKF